MTKKHTLTIFGIFRDFFQKILLFFLNRHASAAIEFAIVVPILLFLHFAIIEVYEIIVSHKNVKRTNTMISDLLTQNASLKLSDIKNIIDASTLSLRASQKDSLKVIISAFEVPLDNSKKGFIRTWSYKFIPRNAKIQRTEIPPLNLSEPLQSKGAFFVRVETILDYEPVFFTRGTEESVMPFLNLPLNFSLNHTAYSRPRFNERITCEDCNP